MGKPTMRWGFDAIKTLLVPHKPRFEFDLPILLLVPASGWKIGIISKLCQIPTADLPIPKRYEFQCAQFVA
jgi:hypothetical protein